MNKVKIFLTILLISRANLWALGQQVTLLENQPIYIEYQNTEKLNLATIILKVTETQTKKKASVELSSVDFKSYKGYFRIQMDMQKLSSQILEFQTKSGNKLFAHVLPSTNSQEKSLSVVLFNSEREWQNYTLQFLNKAREELLQQQNQLLKEVQLSGVGTTTKNKLGTNGKINLKSNNKYTELTEAQKNTLNEKKETLLRFNDRIQEQTRLSFEAQEALKREQAKQDLEQKSKEEQERNKNIAKDKASKADEMYRRQKYNDAAKLYEEASLLDPDNDLFYYQYGICLYKVGNYNKSLSVLSLAEGGDQNPIEHRYYVALNHLKLNELEKSLGQFKDIKEENDTQFSPISAFFSGNIEFQRSNYKESREHFQYVLDYSKDPKLDKSAELKIEQIDRIENFLESQKEIYRYALYMGPQYDSNVLNISPQNLAANVAAYRLQYGGSFTYNVYRTMTSLYALDFGYNDMYSLDQNFKSDSTIQSTDPQSFSFKIPMQHQWKLFSKDFFSNVSPYLTTLSLSNDGGSRKQILASTGISFDLTWSGKKNWAHIARLDYVKENSSLEISDENDNRTGSRITGGYSLIKILNDKSDKSLLADLSLANNTAVGKNNTYTNLKLGISYNFPWSKTYKGSSKMEYTDLKYPQNTQERKDSIILASLSASKDLSKNKNLLFNLAYTVNKSNIESYNYNKYQVGFIFTYSGAYLRK